MTKNNTQGNFGTVSLTHWENPFDKWKRRIEPLSKINAATKKSEAHPDTVLIEVIAILNGILEELADKDKK